MGWQRKVLWKGRLAKALKRMINRRMIVPPEARDLPGDLALAAPGRIGTHDEARSLSFWTSLLPADPS
jgi:hypothetical protein